jgi:flagellar protein FlaJ
MTEEIIKAVDREIGIVRELYSFFERLEYATPEERKMLMESISLMRDKMKEVNNSIMDMLGETTAGKGAEGAAAEGAGKNNKKQVMLEGIGKRKAREEIMRELEISESFLRKAGKKSAEKEEVAPEFKATRGYLKWANWMFLDRAKSMLKKGYFEGLPNEVKKANLDMLSETYVAFILFTTMLSLFAGLAASAAIVFLGLGLAAAIAVPIVLPMAVFAALYYYPATEKGSISKRIDEELPFAVIHMSSISGSGIEPTEIFKIIGLSREYPFLKKEIRKVLNQINIYGYDFVTALNNVSKNTSNPRLAELFNGLSTTINSGGSLSDFFKKRADTLMVSYKLEKEKFIKVAETFMDIYISVVIAAPMILMLLLVMISVAGIQTGFSPYQMTFITIAGVALINIVFLGYLQTRQT